MSIHHVLQDILEGAYPSFFLIAGPCVIESESVCMKSGAFLRVLSKVNNVPVIFKASIRKDNRTRRESFRGINTSMALSILQKVRKTFDLPVTTDVHESSDVDLVGDVVDVIQIPAFLSRQTSLIERAAKSGRIVNIKKGQFLNNDAIMRAAEKALHKGVKPVFITERGSMFGYNDLIVDFRNLPKMKSPVTKVIMDCTHSTQRPNQPGGITFGGNFAESETLAKSALVSGADGLFFEVHPSPAEALSDQHTILSFDELEEMMPRLVQLKRAVNEIYAQDN